MSSRMYFRAALLVPVIVPVVAAVFGFNQFTAMIVLSLFFSGIPYLVFAWGLFVLIGRARTTTRIRWLSLAAPLLFVIVNALFWLAPLALAAGEDGATGDRWQFLKILSGYIVVLGYGYALLVNLGFSFLVRRGIVTEAETG